MQIQSQNHAQKTTKYKDEEVLVVPTLQLFPQPTEGIIPTDLSHATEIIKKNGIFLNRNLVEEDPSYQQIIPFLIFQHQDKFFLMKRSKLGGDMRLHDKYSLGIGGHICSQDMQPNSSVQDWAMREFHEEVSYSGNLKFEFLGLLKNNSDLINQVHTGLVFLLKGDSADIKIQSTEHTQAFLATTQEIKNVWDNLETWGKVVMQHLA